MHPLRHPKATYLAAFLLGAFFALLAVRPARGAETFRLDRIAIVQISLAPARAAWGLPVTQRCHCPNPENSHFE